MHPSIYIDTDTDGSESSADDPPPPKKPRSHDIKQGALCVKYVLSINLHLMHCVACGYEESATRFQCLANSSQVRRDVMQLWSIWSSPSLRTHVMQLLKMIAIGSLPYPATSLIPVCYSIRTFLQLVCTCI